MRARGYWWVSQGTTYERSLKDSTLWAPQSDKRGRSWFYWDNVSKVKAGDVIFHYADGAIRAVSVATTDGQPAAKTLREGRWSDKGWRVNVDVHALVEPLPIQAIGPRLVALNIEKGPVTRAGGASPGYLYELPDDAVESIVEPLNLDGLPPELARALDEWKLTPSQPSLADLPAAFHDALARAGLHYPAELVPRFLAALLTKRFVILSGLSGSGKTRLAQAFAQFIGAGRDAYRVIAVGADWTGNDAIVGYLDRLNGGYVKTDALQLMLHARQDPELPHVLILDEMNLSHVERYFADLLSALESDEPMTLHANVGEVDGVPPRLCLPANLFIIGTVNVDETTYLFSPKVLDRANVIEFRAGHAEMARALQSPQAVALDTLAGAGLPFAKLFVAAARAEAPDLSEDDHAGLTAELLLLFDALSDAGAEFGFRAAAEIARFAAHYGALRQHVEGWLDDAIDAQIMHKLLPRLNGARSQLAPALWSLAVLCGERAPGAPSGDPALSAQLDAARRMSGDDPVALAARDGARYPRSLRKIARMWQALERNGFTSFMDA